MNNQLLEKENKKRNHLEDLGFENISIKGFEKVIKITEKKSRLTAIIAIHNTTLGPSLGGTRIHAYRSFDSALEDVLRLSQGMTYKSALSEVGFGGAKCVVIADPKTEKTPEMLFALGQAIEKLGGEYITAEDVGCSPEDCKVIRQATKYVVGLPQKNSSGNPSIFTAWGVFRGIQASVKKIFSSDSLAGKRVAIQGLGSVGSNLLNYLFWAGAQLIISDIDSEKLQQFARQYGATAVSPDQIMNVECDIFAPCAFGGIINDQTIPRFRCLAIAGAANNQLLRDCHANALKERGILYAPDFVINAGGLLNVAAELEENGYSPSFARNSVHAIYDRLSAIFDIAKKNNDSTHATAIALAEYRIKYGIGKRMTPPVFHHIAE